MVKHDLAEDEIETGKARLFVPSDLAEGAGVPLDPGQSHYLRRVLRLTPGDPVQLFNGRDGEWLARIARFAKQGGEALAERRTRPQPPAPSALVLAFAPIRKQRLDMLIEKAVELGVTRLCPVLTERTSHGRLKRERIEAQIREAAEQCERLDLPVLEEAQPLAAFITGWNPAIPIFLAAEAGEALPLADALMQCPAGSPVGFVIGPEGGFSGEELAFLSSNAFLRAIGLGPRILRAETAAIAVLSTWQALRGDGASRPPGRTV